MKKLLIVFIFVSTNTLSYCEVESNGDIWCSDRGYVGEVESNGDIWSNSNGYVGEVESNGDIWSNTGGYNPNSYKMGW